ncbi:hypothetical protein RND81_05G195200 [Saponaria officinalis]|uniref:Endonuclease/exonuclease/phosphatase domain-containing protein n=1 Tax=Saponaria officinalis TaxID=3572 RepID=A0AAW1L2L0_SAPOF
MFKFLSKNIRRLCSRLRRRNSNPKIIITKFGKPTSTTPTTTYDHFQHSPKRSTVYPNTNTQKQTKPIKIATFNAALFSMAPAVPPNSNQLFHQIHEKSTLKPSNDRPKSILKQSPLHPNTLSQKREQFAKSRLRVSINLPDNEISLGRSRRFDESSRTNSTKGNRAIVDVLRELDADIVALQEIKAEEEKEMKPLSELAEGLGMYYVFADSWAPEYGNAVLSKWPITKFKVQKIFDHSDFRNVLKTTIDVPDVGELNFYCTHLDHLDENWRMKQINAIIQSNDEPHILAGGLNSLDDSDYSHERWTDIVKYYEEIGKPIPKTEVMRFLKGKQYTDAKDFAGECESVVVIAKGQSVQGTCKYGTRLDYILASSGLQYKFVPGSYSVFSSKGTSDHHIVTVDIVKVENNHEIAPKKNLQRKKVVKITNCSTKGIWSTEMR